MTLLTGAIPALYNGVSQQSPLVRSGDQLEDQLNGWSSLADGLQKRPPLEHVATLLPAAPASAYIHEINRDAQTQFIVVASNDRIRVFDLTGQERPVSAPGGWGYLEGLDDYAEQITMLSVADYTFVVNRTKTCAMMERGADLVTPPAYYLWLNPRHGTDGNFESFYPGAPYQYPPNPTGVLTGTVQAFDKLPTDTAANGAIYRIWGSADNGFVSYYVRKSGAVWDETLKPGMVNAIDATTMPHALVRQEDGSFIFAPFSWAPRRMGDEDTNPNPAFIGRTINSVIFYQNRLGFLTDDAVVMSASGEFGNFWRSTVLDYIDSDTLEVAATTTEVAILKHALPFNDGVLLFSDQVQFSLSNGEDGLNATSVAIRPVTFYNVASRAAPVAIGSEAYFASEQVGWASIREYSRQADTDATSASDVTAHVRSLIPAGVHRIAGAADLNALFVLSDGAPSKVYVYQFYWVGSDQKAQSSWHVWDFGDGARVLSAAYLRGYLYLLMSREDGLFLERINLQRGARPAVADAQVHLDRQAAVTGAYNPATQRTTFVLPYAPRQGELRLVRGRHFADRPMSMIDPTSYTWEGPRTLVVPGDETAGPCVCGERYVFRFEFSRIYARRNDGNAITTGRLQLRTITVNYRETGYFKTVVSPYGDAAPPEVVEVLPAKIAEFTGKVLGSADLILNRPSFAEGSYAFQVYGHADTATISIENDSHVGSTFVSAEWEAFYWNRARV